MPQACSRSVGALTIEVVIPHYAEITLPARVQSRSEAAAYHMLDLRTRWSDYGIHTRDAVAQGALYSASDVVQAQRVRQYGKKLISELMRPFEVLVTLSSGRRAPPIEGLTTETFSRNPSFTSIWNSDGVAGAVHSDRFYR